MAGHTDVHSTASRAKEAILGSGLSQRQVAQAIGIDETKLSKSLSGRRAFKAAELVGMATATGVTVRWILGEDSTVSVTPPDLLSEAGEFDHPAESATPRRLIVETAWELFAGHGYEAVRIADIAQVAGVSSASIHYYFPGKSELFDATLRFSVKLAFDRQIAWLGAIANPRRRLIRLLDLQSPIGTTARSEWSIWLQTWCRLALEETPNPDYLASYGRWSETVRTTLEDGQDHGVVVAGNSTEMADELTSLLDGLGVKVLTGVMTPATFRQRLSSYLDRTIFVHKPDEESQ